MGGSGRLGEFGFDGGGGLGSGVGSSSLTPPVKPQLLQSQVAQLESLTLWRSDRSNTGYLCVFKRCDSGCGAPYQLATPPHRPSFLSFGRPSWVPHKALPQSVPPLPSRHLNPHPVSIASRQSRGNATPQKCMQTHAFSSRPSPDACPLQDPPAFSRRRRRAHRRCCRCKARKK